MEHDILIDESGGIQFVYDDEVVPVFAGEEQTTVRASHVEPHPTRTGWLADMRPSGGPVLGANGTEHDPVDHSIGITLNELPIGLMGDVQRHIIGAVLEPFPTRAEALAAERAWLRREKGL